MSDSSNVTTHVHDFVASVKAQRPGTKFDYPPAAMGIIDPHSEYFATNALLTPVMFSAIGVLKTKLRASDTNASDLEELEKLGIDVFNEAEADDGREQNEDRAYELGFDVPERSTMETVKFAYSLRMQQVKAGFRMYGKDNPYPPYTIQQALDFLITAEPRNNIPALKSAVATQLDQELASMGIDMEELHRRESGVILRREETSRETTRSLRDDIIAAFKEAGTVDVVTGWQALPVLLQYKCVVKCIDSLMQATARKSAMVKSFPTHPNKAQMENELAPLGEVIHTLTLDCHAVYKANRALFDDAFTRGFPDLPKLTEVKAA